MPSFEMGMYDSISVEEVSSGRDDRLSIFLNEKTGDRVALKNTSAGRRWYFTYYFMKSLLEEGDMFIIDEPASALHPCAQREVLRELTELAKRGIHVVYSTHSPYLIPKDWACVHSVLMTDRGTCVSRSLSDRDLVARVKEIVGEDVFDIAELMSKYQACDVTSITEQVYQLVIDTQKKRGIRSQQAACDEIGISLDTLKSWRKYSGEFHAVSLENLLKVLKWSESRFEDVLG
jgi:ABC-type multidrug transport system ATPase subunit